MNLETYLQNAVKSARKDSFDRSNQLTLGELILKLEPIVEKQKNRDKDSEAYVRFDFEYAYPTTFGSWRGSYDELSIGFDFVGYGPKDNEDGKEPKVSDFLKMCEETVGKEFTGWKGGEFIMTKNTPIWVANSGNSGNTGIVDVIDDGYEVILITQYCEY